jgi:preprotein translocase subunit SecF
MMKEATPSVPTGSKAPAARAHFRELLPAHTNIDFVKWAPRMIVVSVTFILIGLLSIYLRGGLNYGIDFVGGTLVRVRFPEAKSTPDVREALEASQLRGVTVQEVGSEGREFQIRVQAEDETAVAASSDATRAALLKRFGADSYEILSIESVGPKVGRDLWRRATLAVLASTVIMGIYIAIRFDLRFGVGAAVALLHDVLFALAAISLADMEFDLTTVAALLTIVGFSVNDNVVISDRIRENMGKQRKGTPLTATLNTAINETLSRTVVNSGTVIFVATALFLLGGAVIHSFAYTLLIGFIIGTYSSIFVTTPTVLFVERHLPTAV